MLYLYTSFTMGSYLGQQGIHHQTWSVQGPTPYTLTSYAQKK
jgi:hypothetical protein